MRITDNYTVLIIDDDVGNRVALAELFGKANIGTLIAQDGRQGIWHAETGFPHVILVNSAMAGMEGFETCKKLKENENTKDIPLLFICGTTETQIKLRGFQSGAADVITTPYQEEEVLARIHAHARSRQRQIDLQRINDTPIIGEAEYERLIEKRLYGSSAEIKGSFREVLNADQRSSHESEKQRGIADLLRESDGMAVALLKISTYAVWLLSVDGTILEMNKRAAAVLGVENEAVVGAKIWKYIDESEFNAKKKCFDNVVGLDEPTRREALYRGRFYEMCIHPITDDAKKVLRIAIFGYDITEKKMLQEQIVRFERLAATGQLAASIAHEINSPLIALGFTIHTLEKKLEKDVTIRTHFELLKNGVKNIRETVENLLDLNRPGKHFKQPMDINDVIRKTIALNQSFLKREKIGIHLDLLPEIPSFTGSPQQFSQMMIHLIRNSVEAIRSADVKNGKIGISTHMKENHIEILFWDNGPGIHETDMKRIFDPFYTRKKKMGMGIGLSICLGVIENHGGVISVSNIESGGALFRISLPISKETPDLENHDDV